MQILLAPHIFHHVGLVVLVSSVVGRNLPSRFAWTIAIGDSSVLILAIVSAAALRRRSPSAAVFLWIFTAVGFLYNGYAGLQASRTADITVENLGPHWYVGILYVPLLLVSHLLIFYNLIRRRTELQQ
jgi:threonine/homoserine/homoserine lactone efflux protein